MEALLPFFQWMGTLPMSQYFLSTTWSTPIVQVIHLVAIAAFVGAVLIVDMRLLGVGLTETPLPKLARAAEPWLIGAFIVLLITGLPQLTSTALKQYYSPFFWWKMEAMLLALGPYGDNPTEDDPHGRCQSRLLLAKGRGDHVDGSLGGRHHWRPPYRPPVLTWGL